jgi:hypothetical protein
MIDLTLHGYTREGLSSCDVGFVKDLPNGKMVIVTQEDGNINITTYSTNDLAYPQDCLYIGGVNGHVPSDDLVLAVVNTVEVNT